MPALGRALLLLLLVASAVHGWRTLRRHGGPVAYWVLAWAAAGSSGALTLVEDVLPGASALGHPLGTLFAALLLAGSLAFADRPAPAWLVPGALAWGAVRAVAATAGEHRLAWLLGLALEPWLVLAGAGIVWRAARAEPEATRSERWLGAAFAVLALLGAFHLAWLASGRPPALLVPLWVVGVPPLLGLQIQAGADRLRRRMQHVFEARVAERTAALAASEERHRAISELTSDLSFRVRITPGLQLAREWTTGAVETITGLAPAALDGHGWLALLDEAQGAALPEQLAALPPGTRREIERTLRGPRGEGRRIAVRFRVAGRAADGSVDLIGSASDVTDRRRAEEERRRLEGHLQQVQRLESLGVLAGGIAHDFNNLLTVIRGHARLARTELPPGAPLRARLERIDEAAAHAAALTGQMLTYAGQVPSALGPLDLGAVVTALGDLLLASLGDRCKVEIECAPGLPAVEGDPAQLQQVVLNLALNAADAIGPGRGRVAIRIAAAEVDARTLSASLGHRERAPGRYVVLEVEDDGCGMDAATAARVCEPFFTTKFSGRGLGMAAVLGIVRAHRGALAIESQPGAGTTVRVLLPASARPAEAAPAPPASPPTPSARGTVLVVDDDAVVRELTAELLTRAGFGVTCAAGGADAVASLARGERVDAVLLDLTMPDLDGEETFRRLRRLRPGLPVVLVSGFDAERARGRFPAEGVAGFLHKPFEPEELVAALAGAIAGRERGMEPPAASAVPS